MRYLAPLLLLAACAAPEPVWIKPGTPALTAEQEFLACAAQARRDFPERSRIATAPSVIIGARSCTGNFCIGGYNGPDIYDYDRNEPLRERSLNACMAAKGYRAADLPACPRGQVAVLQSQPFDTRGLCNANGRIAVPAT
ncbi:hypothetical protein [Jannaschia rubra]|uniref:Uncharacterized protein n=1 Tax=Jannaschia rubra TaxID=282197 RepID=A0A0M6XVC7_9RHOB|nr:hypothetical protein [Jannaschia rubra]CTQ34085.1 hypothetical protein JAN5088_02877 [Jannaschia rubra]SFG23512.1 hypothetical protein SAMN04488517_103261 [Jannaschia rubra]